MRRDIVTSGKLGLLASWKEKLQAIISIIDDIIAGKSEISACRKHDIDNGFFRSIIFRKEINKGYIEEDRPVFAGKTLILTPEERIWCAMNELETKIKTYKDISYLDAKLDIPYDLNETIPEIISEHLTERERLIINEIYYNRKTLEETGKSLRITRERVRQIERKSIRILMKYRQYCILGKEIAEYDRKAKIKVSEIARKKYKSEIDERFSRIKANNTDRDLSEIVATPIESLELSMHLYYVLKRANIKTVGDILIVPTYEELSKIRNMGRKSLAEMIDKIHSLGLVFDWECKEENNE